MQRCKLRKCPLWGKKVEVAFERGRSNDIIWVGESPGRVEEFERKPYRGDAGNLIRESLGEVGLSYEDFFWANSARCRILKDELSGKEITEILACCHDNAVAPIKQLRPKAVVLMGDYALRQVTKKSGITKHRGRWIRNSEFDCWVLPVFHPAYILRNMSLRPRLVGDFRMVKEFIDNHFQPPTQKEEDTKHYMKAESIAPILRDRPSHVGFDSETQGLDWTDSNFVFISYQLSWADGEAAEVVFYEESDKKDYDFTIHWPRKAGKKEQKTMVYVKRASNFEKKMEELRLLLEDDKIKKYMVNGNFDVHAVEALFKKEKSKVPLIQGYVMDAQAAANLLDENLYKQSSLQDLQMGFTDMREDYKSEFEKKYGRADMLAVIPEARKNYSCADADVTRRAGLAIKKELCRNGNRRIANYLVKFTMPALSFLAHLERNGALIDKKRLPEVTKDIYSSMVSAEDRALRLMPSRIRKEFDITPQQIKECREAKKFFLTRDEIVSYTLFDRKGFSIPGVRQTAGKEAWSVAKDVRKILATQNIPDEARNFLVAYEAFQEDHTMWSRYLKGFANAIKWDGRIHSSYSLATAVNGRTSSSKPNMQNNPKRSSQSMKIRELICAPPGYVLLSVDQEQCLVAETPIVTVDGILPLSEVLSRKHPILTCDDQGQFAFNDVVRSWSTGKSGILKISFDNGSSVECTQKHRFRTFRWEWKQARELRVGDRLAHVYRMFCDSKSKNYPEIGVGWRGTGTHGVVRRRLHQLVAEYLNGRRLCCDQHVHHLDGDIKRWVRSNISIKGKRSHASLHSRGKSNSNFGKISGHVIVCPVCGRERYCYRSQDYVTCSKRCANKFFGRRGRRNHKIVRIEDIGVRETFQIEVKNVHNYVLGNGLISKNSELRWYAEVSKDFEMMQIFENGEDIHTATALGMLGWTIERWNRLSAREKELRRREAKVANFGLLYGMSSKGFVEYARNEYGVILSLEQAEKWRDSWFSKYSGVRPYQTRMIDLCRKQGYVESPLGRRRRLSEINSKDPFLRGEAERMAINHPVSSPSSDVVLMSGSEIMKKKLDPKEIRPILFVHDELTFEIRENKIDKWTEVIKNEMENPPIERDFEYKMSVPLVAELKVGNNLATLEKV